MSWTPHNVPRGSGFPVRFVGLDANDPGSGWEQGGGGWEQGQPSNPNIPQGSGVTGAQISDLKQKVADLKNQVDGIAFYMTPDTDAASQAAVKALQAKVQTLSSEVATLVAGTWEAVTKYPTLLSNYNAYKAELDSWGLENVTPDEPANPAQGKPAATPGKTTVVQPPAAPDSPVIKTEAPEGALTPTANNTVPWLLLVGAGLLGLAAIYFSAKAGR